MKVSDIKGSFGERVISWVESYINNRIFDEVKMFASSLVFREQITIHNMHDFKKFLSGKQIGFPTHACKSDKPPYHGWKMHPLRSGYIADSSEITTNTLDITDPLFTASIDLVPIAIGVPTKRNWWELRYCIQCNRDAMMEKLSNMFDNDLVKVKTASHTDICGNKLNINDIICYTTSYDNTVIIGTIKKFNDYSMVVDGHTVSYDAGVLIVNKEIQFNEQEKQYQHR